MICAQLVTGIRNYFFNAVCVGNTCCIRRNPRRTSTMIDSDLEHAGNLPEFTFEENLAALARHTSDLEFGTPLLCLP